MTSGAAPIRDLQKQLHEFRQKLEEIRRMEPKISWYPYDTLGVFEMLSAFPIEEQERVLKLCASQPLMDIGCGDGVLSLFLETLGSTAIDCIDYSPTNFNGMKGVTHLKNALRSTIRIHDMNVEQSNNFPRDRYAMAIMLGVLYHVKNVYSLLERIAKVSQFCLLSTRVAKFSPDRSVRLQNIPVAYLVDPDELNGDDTNYWIFSETGLRRILARTGWSVCAYVSTGAESISDPVHPNADERVFCLVRSRLADPEWNIELVSGWHPLEQGAWRWTERRFCAVVPAAGSGPNASVRIAVYVPEAHLSAAGEITLRVRAGGEELEPMSFSQPGFAEFVRPLSQGAKPGEMMTVECELDKALSSGADARERGIVIPFFVPGESLSEAVPPIQVLGRR